MVADIMTKNLTWGLHRRTTMRMMAHAASVTNPEHAKQPMAMPTLRNAPAAALTNIQWASCVQCEEAMGLLRYP